jgi:hypothetical protein
MSRLVKSSLLLLFLLSCKPGPPPKQTVTPLMHPTVLTFDTLSLGDPVSAFLDRFGDACDDDPIDKEKANLWFWAGAEGCKEQKPFPEETTVLVVTPYSKAAKEQPVELVAWFGGTYFNARSTMKIHIGDSATEVQNKLGEPVFLIPHLNVSIPGADGYIPGMRRADYQGEIHVLYRDEKVVGIAVGKLKGGEERESTLVRGYEHHLRYVK